MLFATKSDFRNRMARLGIWKEEKDLFGGRIEYKFLFGSRLQPDLVIGYVFSVSQKELTSSNILLLRRCETAIRSINHKMAESWDLPDYRDGILLIEFKSLNFTNKEKAEFYDICGRNLGSNYFEACKVLETGEH